ncbi:MAG: 50S ribosomal protein L18 [candidate division WOR-3 bacterium]
MAVSEREKTFLRFYQRKRRQKRIGKKVIGTSERPRLCVVKSHRHLYAQLIIDPPGAPSYVITGASTLSPGLRENLNGGMVEKAKSLGAFMAKRVQDKGYKRIVFDRSGYPYHGVIKAFADALREGGLEF